MSTTKPAPPGFVRTRDGVDLFVRDWGSGPPILLLGGWGLTSSIWGPVMLRLAEGGHRVIAYDRRGHGRSAEAGRLDYDILADDLAQVLEALRLRDATVVAHSGGGGEVVRCVTRQGAGRIARLLLLAPSLPFPMRTADNPAGVDPAMLKTLWQALRDDLPRWLAENGRPFVNPDTPQEVIAWVSAMILSCSLKALIDFQRVIGETDFREELATLALPTTVIHGDRDVSAPLDSCGRRTAAIVPGATLTVYEDAAHGLMLTHAERLAGDIAAFARARPRRAARARGQLAAQAGIMGAKASAAEMVASGA